MSDRIGPEYPCEFEDFKEGYHHIRNQITDQIIDEEADDFQ